jgi:hypothetical protein
MNAPGDPDVAAPARKDSSRGLVQRAAGLAADRLSRGRTVDGKGIEPGTTARSTSASGGQRRMFSSSRKNREKGEQAMAASGERRAHEGISIAADGVVQQRR